MISPVDGADPFGIQEVFCITPGEKFNFDLPALVMAAGYDGMSGMS